MPNYDLAGNTLIVKDIQVGATTPGSTGTSLSSTELSYVDGVTAGTALASKAVVLGSSKEIATITTATITGLTSSTIAVTTITPTTIAGGTFSTTPVLGAGTTIDLDSTTQVLSANAATISKYACVVTTESLTTASGASQAFVITLAGVAAGDLAFVQAAGGGNTRKNYFYEAVTTSNTVTVTVYNNHGSALNGTLIFNLWVLKA